MSWTDLIGYAASATVLATFCMTTMLYLRLLAIASNLLFHVFRSLGARLSRVVASYGAVADQSSPSAAGESFKHDGVHDIASRRAPAQTDCGRAHTVKGVVVNCAADRFS